MSDQEYQPASEDVPPSTQPNPETQISQNAESENGLRTRKASKTPLPTIAEEETEENPGLHNGTSGDDEAANASGSVVLRLGRACSACRKKKTRCKHRLGISEDNQVSLGPTTPPQTRKRKAEAVPEKETKEEQVEPESQTKLKKIKLTLSKNKVKGKGPTEEAAESATATKKTRGRPRKRPVEETAAGENEDSNPPAVKRPKDNKAQEQTVSAESVEASTAPTRRKNTAARNLEDAASLSYFRVMMRETERKLKDFEDRLEASKKGLQEALELFDRAKQSFREAKGVMDAIEEKFVNGE